MRGNMNHCRECNTPLDHDALLCERIIEALHEVGEHEIAGRLR